MMRHWRRRQPAILLGFAALACGLAGGLLVRAGTGANKISVTADAGHYLGDPVGDLAALIERLRADQDFWLPLLVPDPDFIHMQEGGPIEFDPAGFPDDFLENLVPTLWRGVLVYPIRVFEDAETRAAGVVNADGELLALVPASADYDPYRYAGEIYAILRGQGIEAPRSALEAIYDPARLVMEYRLILGDEARLYAQLLQDGNETLATLSTEALDPLATANGDTTAASQADPDRFAVTGIVPHPSGTGMLVSIHVPAGVTQVDIFGSDDPGGDFYGRWTLLTTTNLAHGPLANGQSSGKVSVGDPEPAQDPGAGPPFGVGGGPPFGGSPPFDPGAGPPFGGGPGPPDFVLDLLATLPAANRMPFLTAQAQEIQWWDQTADAARSRFYTAANADLNEFTDPDGDNLTWGREVFLYGTDPESWDTDGDGLLDGYNIAVGPDDWRYEHWAAAGIAYEQGVGQRTFLGELTLGTDPNNPDITPPETIILHPAPGSSYVWMP